MEKYRIGWIGTGIMGSRMAGHLLEAGHRLLIYDKRPEAMASLAKKGAIACATAQQVAEEAEFMFIMVVYPDQLQQIVLSPQSGLLSSLSPGTILIDCSTSSPDLEVKIAAQAAQKGVQYLDAPVSGGPSGAEEGSLAFMVGGCRNIFERALPLLQLMGKKVVLQGEIGKGQYTKIVNQILIASNIMGVCEAYTFASKAALSLKDVFESVQDGAAGSFMLDFAWPRIQTGDLKPGFYVEHFIKDLKIAIEEAGRLDLCLPALNLAKQLYHAVRNIAGQGIGTQGLISVFEALNGYEASTQSRHMR